MHEIEIIGVPVACKKGLKETWREVAEWTTDKLKATYGNRVRVRYYDLFDSNIPVLPTGEPLPIVMIDGILISCGTKISIPLIRRKIQELDSAQSYDVQR